MVGGTPPAPSPTWTALDQVAESPTGLITKSAGGNAWNAGAVSVETQAGNFRLRYDWKNLQALCRFHHDRKSSMEDFARKNGLLDQLPAWCADPALRRNFASG